MLLGGPAIKKEREREMLLRDGNLQRHSQWRKLFKQARCTSRTRWHDRDCFELN